MIFNLFKFGKLDFRQKKMKWWLWLLVAGIKEIKAYNYFNDEKKILIGTETK